MSNDLTYTSQAGIITDEQRAAAEAEIREQRQLFDYNTKEYLIQNFIQTYVSDSELFLPEVSWNNID